MEAYTDFAQVYDTFMDDTPYEEWCDYLVELMEKHRKSPGPAEASLKAGTVGDADEDYDDCVTKHNLTQKHNQIQEHNLTQERNTILDLGCGTGTLTELLARKGYDMIGIDIAQEMLRIAMDKRNRSGLDILYLLQDMRSFELYGTVGAVVSICDSINYLLEDDDVVKTFRLVNNYLFPEGLFIFDFNTIYKYEVVIGDTTIAENREQCSFIWDNYYHEEQQVNEYDLTVFVREDETADIYRRFQETHYQRGYCLEQMQDYLRQAGLVFVEAVDADTHGQVTDTSERIYVVARKGNNTGNTADDILGGIMDT